MSQQKIRVLVVDDAAMYRRIVSDLLDSDPEIEVVGSASNGRIALQRIEQYQPDVVTLDIEMPEMDGLETLKQISQLHPHVGTIMVSAQTERGASITIDCLTSVAFDFVSKPSGTGSYEESQKVIREQLLPKVKQCAQKSRKASSKILKPATAPRPVRRIPTNHVPIILRREVVAIGVSTGGPTALAQLIPSSPAELRVGVLVVQHMPPTFTAQLANRLDSLSALKVKEAEEGDEIRAGSVLLAPGGKHMVVTNSNGSKRVSLNTGPPENSCRPAVDTLFRSVAELYKGKVVAAMLTGMGQDGVASTKLLKEKGAFVVAQNEATCVVYGMPKFVVDAGLSDMVLPLGLIGAEIVNQVN